MVSKQSCNKCTQIDAKYSHKQEGELAEVEKDEEEGGVKKEVEEEQAEGDALATKTKRRCFIMQRKLAACQHARWLSERGKTQSWLL